MPRFSLPLALVSGAMILSLGVIAGALLLPAEAPPSIAATARPSSVDATEMRTTDARTATLRVSASSAQKILSRARGTITASDCVAGVAVSSGSGGPAVNDPHLIHLASSQPLWRDLIVGDTGPDVRSLQTELSRLEYRTEVDGRFGAGTLKALKRMGEAAGAADARGWTGFPSTRFIWLPAASVTIASCDAHVGQEISDHEPLATLPRGVSEATVSPLPADTISGDRVIVAGDLTIPVDATGAVALPEDLDRLAASQAYRTYASESGPSTVAPTGQGEPGAKTGLSIQYRLAEPTTVFAVPAAAVYLASGSAGCLVEHGRPRAITIAGSQLGETFVIPRDGKKITSVSISVSKPPRCR